MEAGEKQSELPSPHPEQHENEKPEHDVQAELPMGSMMSMPMSMDMMSMMTVPPPPLGMQAAGDLGTLPALGLGSSNSVQGMPLPSVPMPVMPTLGPQQPLPPTMMPGVPDPMLSMPAPSMQPMGLQELSDADIAMMYVVQKSDPSSGSVHYEYDGRSFDTKAQFVRHFQQTQGEFLNNYRAQMAHVAAVYRHMNGLSAGSMGPDVPVVPRPRKRRKKRDDPSNVYECDHAGCGARFKSSSALYKHRKIHTGLRPFVCTITETCRKSFYSLNDLYTHYRTHTGEKPLRCRYGCDRMFSSYNGRLRHEKQHKATLFEKKPFLCEAPGCDVRFASRSNMRRHMMRKHDWSKGKVFEPKVDPAKEEYEKVRQSAPPPPIPEFAPPSVPGVFMSMPSVGTPQQPQAPPGASPSASMSVAMPSLAVPSLPVPPQQPPVSGASDAATGGAEGAKQLVCPMHGCQFRWRLVHEIKKHIETVHSGDMHFDCTDVSDAPFGQNESQSGLIMPPVASPMPPMAGGFAHPQHQQQHPRQQHQHIQQQQQQQSATSSQLGSSSTSSQPQLPMMMMPSSSNSNSEQSRSATPSSSGS